MNFPNPETVPATPHSLLLGADSKTFLQTASDYQIPDHLAEHLESDLLEEIANDFRATLANRCVGALLRGHHAGLTAAVGPVFAELIMSDILDGDHLDRAEYARLHGISRALACRTINRSRRFRGLCVRFPLNSRPGRTASGAKAGSVESNINAAAA